VENGQYQSVTDHEWWMERGLMNEFIIKIYEKKSLLMLPITVLHTLESSH